MKNYRILSLLALVLMLALAGGASSLMLTDSPVEVKAQSPTFKAIAVNAETGECVPMSECSDKPCVPMTPEQCAAKMGVDVETVKEWMKKCESRTTAATSGRLINVESADCDPTDCDPSDCKPRPDCKTAQSCSSSSQGIDASI